MADGLADILRKFALSEEELGGAALDLGDVDSDIRGGPWILDNQILVMKKWTEGIEEDDQAFRIAPLWLQVWNLPVHWLLKDVGRKIGLVFKGVREVIVPQIGGKEGRHLKLLVDADISRPLMRGTTVQLNGTIKWLSFRYERCPDFCYKCGIVGHSERSCKAEVRLGKDKQDNQYGPWMRASWGKGSPPEDLPDNRYTKGRAV
ncbi:uncharacterized protein LOC113752292 [Coffea eugenioides]|uniref:uncharacterized protein LOC113752292 n=1 Tax=Coffea eugenioides TaxID=49369 RepID=UPI000F6150B9|nr:uncharacterized protein LOC113752292 [Coffea eugenioides]